MRVLHDVVFMAVLCLAIYNVGRVQTRAIDWVMEKALDYFLGKGK